MTLLSAGDIASMYATMVQLANATLTTIETPGALAPNGDPGTPVAAWTGAARAFLERESVSTMAGDTEVEAQADTLLVFDEAGAVITTLGAGPDWGASTVVISDERLPVAQVRRYTVVGMVHEADGTLDHVKLTLNAARPVA